MMEDIVWIKADCAVDLVRRNEQYVKKPSLPTSP